MTPQSETDAQGKEQAELRFGRIVKKIAENIKDEITAYFASLKTKKDKDELIDEIITDPNKANAIKNNKNPIKDLEQTLKDKAFVWEKHVNSYLESSIQNVLMNKISVSSDNRARAIDIYENLNMGGVCLNVFDLITAKVGKVSNKPFKDRIVDLINNGQKYPLDVIPEAIINQFNKFNKNQKYNATENTGCYLDQKDEINIQFINAFLNVISLYINNENYEPDNYKLDYTKRNEILKLQPIKINDNTEKVCQSIDRALFFFQTRCGIRNINEINYSLMIPLVSIIFTNDKWFKNKGVHDTLEAWYWTSLFSGNYDRDQGERFIDDLRGLTKVFLGKEDKKWILNDKEYILNFPNFSDKELLLMQKEDKVPKSILKKFICQYFLSNTYKDMFDAHQTVSVFSEEADTLEAHHIIPLGSVKNYGESTKKLRKDDKNICNSPLNYVYITSSANKSISSASLEEYTKKITSEAKSGLYLTAPIEQICYENSENIKKYLSNRYTCLIGDIKTRVSKLLGE